VGLAIVLLIFRNRETVDIDDLREMGDNAQPVRRTTTTPEIEHETVRRG
jgi:hypothetical protein